MAPLRTHRTARVGENKKRRVHGATQRRVEDAEEKQLVVVPANTVVQKVAMVVHVEDAALTGAAVVAAVGLVLVAHLAEA